MASYTIKKGDTLSAIAKKSGTTTAALIAANKAKLGANPNKIFSGTVLTLPGAPAAPKTPPSASAKYVPPRATSTKKSTPAPAQPQTPKQRAAWITLRKTGLALSHGGEMPIKGPKRKKK